MQPLLLYALLPLMNSENFHPKYCTVTKYVFAFVREGEDVKVHGLWPDVCKQCSTCGYPTCCNIEEFMNFTMPENVDFLDEHWLNARLPHKIQTCGVTATTLIEHEVLKHASCMNMRSDEYVALVEKLFYQNFKYIDRNCDHECEIYLAENFSIIE